MNAEWTIPLGATAERVAQIHGVTRDDQDQFALESQRRAACAQRDRVFDEEIIPVPVTTKDGPGIVDRDEHPRPDTTIDTLARLKPAFVEGGTVTAGTTSGINDGASALTIVSEASLDGRRPLARIVATAVAGVDPAVMGLGPIPATRKALQRAGIDASQLDVIELNEAFASQAIACIHTLDLDPARVNVYGGAIALGHALGSSGSRMLVTLVHALRRRGGRYGLATMCVGVGQGVAVVVESL
jgi:acetyl-CoA acetyltransferase family protein